MNHVHPAKLAAVFCLAAVSPAAAQLVNNEWNTGSGDWNIPANWSQNDVPDNGGGLTFDVEIGNRAVAAGAAVRLVPEDGTSDTITSLTVSGGADLQTNGNALFVTGQTTISGVGSSIFVEPATGGGTAFNTDNLDINNTSALQMAGGTADVDVLLEVNSGSITGHGLIVTGDSDAIPEVGLENSANIIVGNTTNALLTLQAVGADMMDLDGTTETGLLDVANVNANVGADTLALVVDGPLADAFSGTIQVGQRDTVTFNDDFTMDGAAVQLDGGTAVATMNGPAEVTDVQNSAFTITGDAAISNNLAFTGTANSIAVNAGSSLTLGGTVTLPDASALNFVASSAELVVTGSTSISEPAGNFNWDGPGTAVTTVSGTGSLSLNVNLVDTGDNIYGGTLNLNDNGDLTVNNAINSWQAAGTVNKNNAGTSSINGDEFAVTGHLNVNAGTLDVNAAAIFGSTSNVVIASGATALMSTAQIFNGADIVVNGTLSLGAASVLEAPATLTGPGLFRFNSTSTVTANAVVNTQSFDWDGTGTGSAHTINDGVVFTVNSSIWDADDGTPGVDDNISLGGNGAQIIVNNVPDWTMARTLNANTAGAGTASIGGSSPFRLEGASAILNVDGNTNITAPLTWGAGSSVSIDTGFTLNATNAVTYAGGTIGGTGTYLPGTANTVTADTTITAATFDFDDGNWTIDPGALLTVNVTDYDTTATNAFDSAITLNNGDVSVTTGDAEFVMDGTLNMISSTAGGITVWTGEPLDIGNDAGALDANLSLSGTQQTQIAPAIDFNSDAEVNIADGATLSLLSTVNFDTVNGANNAQFTGSGRIACSGPVNVNEAAVLNLTGGEVDLDGLDGVGDFVNIDAPFTINTGTMANFGRVNGGGGVNTLDINNSTGTGVLAVTLDAPAAEWTLNGPGVMNLVNDNTEATLLAGSAVNINGTLNVTGDVRTTARLDIAGAVNVTTAGRPLRLAGGSTNNPNILAGGTITGAGLLSADDGRALHGFGTISTGVDFDLASNLFADNGTLTITGPVVDVSRIGTADADGVLNIVNPWDTGVAAFVTLEGGTLQGGTVTISNPNGVSGEGLITARLINNVRLRSSDGLLVVQTAANDNDWDGAAGAGVLTAINAGTLELRDTATFGFTGTVEASGSSRVFTSGFALDFEPGSQLRLTASTYESTNTTDLGGTVNILAGGESTLRVQDNRFLSFQTGSTTTLNSNLRLENNSVTVDAGAVFGGTGALILAPQSHMVTDPNANINVLLNMQGNLRIANSEGIGRVDVRDYQQSATGTLQVEITGTALNAFDRLVVNGAAQIGGFLSLDLDGGFVPAAGDTFDILTASAGVSGKFQGVQTSGMPAGKVFELVYLPNAVRVTVQNGTHYDAWINSFPSLTTAAQRLKTADPDGDGLNNLGEFALNADPTKPGGATKQVARVAIVGGQQVFTLTVPLRYQTVELPAHVSPGPYAMQEVDDSMNYFIEAADVLNAWTVDVTEVTGPDADAIQAGLPPVDAGWTWRTFRSAGAVPGDSREFMRVRVTE